MLTTIGAIKVHTALACLTDLHVILEAEEVSLSIPVQSSFCALSRRMLVDEAVGCVVESLVARAVS